MYDNTNFILLWKLNSITTNKVNISGVTVLFHVLNKKQKLLGDYFDGSVFSWQLPLCQNSHVLCMIIAVLSYCKSYIPL